MHITDRSKDVIKSGGEWISSIEIENVAVGHPQVPMQNIDVRRASQHTHLLTPHIRALPMHERTRKTTGGRGSCDWGARPQVD